MQAQHEQDDKEDDHGDGTVDEVIRRPPPGACIIGCYKGQTMVASQGANFPTQGRSIDKIALPGPETTGPQSILEHVGIAGFLFHLCHGITQSIIQHTITRHAVDSGSERIQPAIIEGTKAIPMAGQM